MINDYKIGKVHDFDGFSGYIITDEYNYPFSKKELKENVNNGDIVSFVSNVVIFGNEKTYVAKAIRKYNSKDLKKLFNDNKQG